MLKATITLNKKYKDLDKLFLLEDKEFQNQRANYEVKKTSKETIFEIQAKDSVALRAILNTITKLISVYEKTHETIEKWNN